MARKTDPCTQNPLEEHLHTYNTGPVTHKKGRTYILSTRQLLGATDQGPGSSSAGMKSKSLIL